MENIKASKTAVRHIINFNRNWEFCLLDDLNAETPITATENKWRKLDLPHDWSIEGSFSPDHRTTSRGAYLPAGIGKYRKEFILPVQWKENRIRIEFDGVYMNSEVFINGFPAGKRKYGYTSFAYDITEFCRFGPGPNMMEVFVDNSVQPNCRWYSGSGIYRDVRLVSLNPLHVKLWGTFITTPSVTTKKAEVTIMTTVVNENFITKNYRVKTVVIGPKGKVEGRTTTKHRTVKQATEIIEQHISISSPSLWSPDSPSLYTARTQIYCGTELVDTYDTRFGIRSLDYDLQKGLKINGKQVKLKGVCLHHDNGCLGAVANKRAIERKLEKVKSMGANAVRTSHNPPSPLLLDACDRMGMLVMDEAFDEWRVGKAPGSYVNGTFAFRSPLTGYHTIFEEEYDRDLRAMVRRDRNHPSVVMYSIGNEIRDIKMTPVEAKDICRRLCRTIKEEDATRPVTLGHMPGACEAANRSGINEVLDIPGYNYRCNDYEPDRKKYPHRLFLGSETSTMQGFFKRSKYGLEQLRAGENRHHFIKRVNAVENNMKLTLERDWIIGEFMWTGIDYLGEPTPYSWPSRSSYFAPIDLAGFPKDGYYYYKACWTKEPVLHIFPHWSWEGKEGEDIPVWCYTNSGEVELFCNGKSFGKRTMKGLTPHHLEWSVPYTPGELKAVGRFSNGKKITTVVRTTGPAYSLKLGADRDIINADGHDLVYITAELLDRDKNISILADDIVSFTVTGPARIIGVDNGDPEYVGSLKAGSIPALGGKCICVVQARDKGGMITVKAQVEGMGRDSVSVKCVVNGDRVRG